MLNIVNASLQCTNTRPGTQPVQVGSTTDLKENGKFVSPCITCYVLDSCMLIWIQADGIHARYHYDLSLLSSARFWHKYMHTYIACYWTSIYLSEGPWGSPRCGWLAGWLACYRIRAMHDKTLHESCYSWWTSALPLHWTGDVSPIIDLVPSSRAGKRLSAGPNGWISRRLCLEVKWARKFCWQYQFPVYLEQRVPYGAIIDAMAGHGLGLVMGWVAFAMHFLDLPSVCFNV